MELDRRELEMILLALRNQARTLKHMDDDLVRNGIIDGNLRVTLQKKITDVAVLAEKIAKDLGQDLGNLYLG